VIVGSSRGSPRYFLDLPIEPDTLADHICGARLAPSAHNSQTWRIWIVPYGEGRGGGRIFNEECLPLSAQSAMGGNAPVLILCATATVA